VKIGWFPPLGECTSESKSIVQQTNLFPIAATQLPQPAETFAVSHDDTASLFYKIGSWLENHCPTAPPGYVASVHPDTLAILQEMFVHRWKEVTAKQLPMEVQVEEPEKVGIDRLLNALAINQVREPGRPAIVVDLGTACTVDRISADGAFEGGAILPGVRLAAEALHTGTALLPRLDLDFDLPAEVVGTFTQAAMHSGLFWGVVGSVRELVTRMSKDCQSQPHVFVTGGDAALLVKHLQTDELSVRHLPSLVLSGIALVVEDLS